MLGNTKANAFLGMLGLALTVIATIIGVLLDKDFVIVQGDWHLDPGDVWRLAVEVTRDRFDQNWEGGLAAQATGLPHGEESLDPAITLLIVGPLHHLAPQHGKP